MDSKPNIDPSLYKIDDSIMKQSNLSYTGNGDKDKNIPLEQIRREFDSFQAINFDNSAHQKELLQIFPSWLLEQASDTNIKHFLNMNRYDIRNNTFIAGCFENAPTYCRLVSYKWRQLPRGKWITKKGTHPNSSVFIKIYPDKRAVFILEGVRDAATAVLLGINFIMIPYAGYRNPNPEKLQQEVTDRDLVFLVEDEAAYKCMSVLAQLLAQTANRVTLKQLNNKNNSKVDLSDYIQNFNTIQEVKNGLQN